MNKLFYILLLISFVDAKVIYTKGEILDIKSCNKYRWCKVGNMYLKGHQLKNISKNRYSVIKDKVYAYKKISELQNDFGYTKLGLLNEINKVQYSKVKKVIKKKNLFNNDETKVLKVLKDYKIKPVSKIVDIIVEEKRKDSFLSLFIGINKVSVDDKNISSFNLKEKAFDDRNLFYQFSYGQYLNDKISAEINFSQTKLDLATITNALVEINYDVDLPINTFIGLNIGYSKLKWDKSPSHQITTINTNNSNSFAYGFQIGSKYELYKDISLLLKYQFINHNEHKTILNIGTYGELNHKFSQQLSFGLRYAF